MLRRIEEDVVPDRFGGSIRLFGFQQDAAMRTRALRQIRRLARNLDADVPSAVICEDEVDKLLLGVADGIVPGETEIETEYAPEVIRAQWQALLSEVVAEARARHGG